ncbi:MAG: hypothetical protein AB8B56_21175 [Crocinitomicaceae bacterium]
MRQFLLLVGFPMIVFCACTSNSSNSVQEEKEIAVEEPPRLRFEIEQDTLTKKWSIAYEWKDQKDTIHTEVTGKYTFVDTVHVDERNLPEIIVERDSLFSKFGYNQRGMWHYSERFQILDVWSVDKGALLGSIVKSVETEYDDDWQWSMEELSQEEKSESTRKSGYEYDIVFKPGSIVIKNLKKEGYFQLKPTYVEGEYTLKEGVLTLIGEELD